MSGYEDFSRGLIAEYQISVSHTHLIRHGHGVSWEILKCGLDLIVRSELGSTLIFSSRYLAMVSITTINSHLVFVAYNPIFSSHSVSVSCINYNLTYPSSALHSVPELKSVRHMLIIRSETSVEAPA